MMIVISKVSARLMMIVISSVNKINDDCDL